MDYETRITVLTDNAPAEELHSEWGLSLLVEHANTKTLLDFGQTDAFAKNATLLGIDLSRVDVAVLSHAHYDHANGMETFFGINAHAPLYLSDACAETCWSTKGGTTAAHYIGIRPGLMLRFADRLIAVPHNCVTTIAPGMHVIPHSTPRLANKGKRDGMLLKTGGQWQPDDFSHEVSLAIELGCEADSPIAVLNSCSHAGAGAILQEVHASFPNRQIDAYVGGLHLKHASDNAILRVARDFEHEGVCHVYTGHCTGERALALLDDALPTQVSELRPGFVIRI